MNKTKPLRRPPAGGYARGEETRLRIIEAAAELFGMQGFAATSTREIATRAGVNAPALQYYFENKEGVYRACAEHFAAEARAHFEPVIVQAQQVLQRDADTGQLIAAFLALQEALSDKILGKPVSSSRRLFFVREQSGDEPLIASQILQERFRGPLNRVSAELMARICGTAPDDPLTLIRVATLYGQLLFVHMAPRSTLTLLGSQKTDAQIDAHQAELIKCTVREQTRVLLEHYAAARR